MHNSTETYIEEAERIIAESGLAGGFAKVGRRPVANPVIIEAWGELTSDHEAAAVAHVESGAALGVTQDNLKAIRHTHHRLAQLLAVGVDETKAGRLCNYSPARVSVLKADPAFRELLAYYSANVAEEYADFVANAADLSMDTLQELQRRLDESPETFSIAQLNELLKTLADRSGHGPVNKSVSVNVNVDMAKKLEAARARLRSVDNDNG